MICTEIVPTNFNNCCKNNLKSNFSLNNKNKNPFNAKSPVNKMHLNIFCSCPDNWIDTVEGCFYFANEEEGMTWYEAIDYCKGICTKYRKH